MSLNVQLNPACIFYIESFKTFFGTYTIEKKSLLKLHNCFDLFLNDMISLHEKIRLVGYISIALLSFLYCFQSIFAFIA